MEITADKMAEFDRAIAEEEERVKRPASILIIDHNTLRFHTVDILNTLLFNPTYGKGLFTNFTETFKDYGLYEKNMDRATLVRSKLKHLDFSEVFKAFKKDDNCPQMYQSLFVDVLKLEKESGKRLFTPTQLWRSLSPALERKNLNICVLRHEYETYDAELPGKCRFFTTKNLWKTSTIIKMVKDLGINTIILDDVNMVIALSMALKNTTFIFGDYRYNYADDDRAVKMGVFRNMDLLGKCEFEHKNEYGLFTPYPTLKIGGDTNGK